MVSSDEFQATEKQRAAQIDAKLARFGDAAGQHGALSAGTRRLTLRIPRDSALRLASLSRSVGLKHGALVSLLLDTVSRISPADFFAEVARIRKGGE